MTPGRIITASLALAAGLGIGAETSGAPPPDAPAFPFIEQVLSAGTGDFRKAQRTWRFRFPQDHGAHPGYRAESWLFFGHLSDDLGREFAFHLGFYRLALAANRTPTVSAWSTNEVYRGYFSFTDVAESRFFAAERFARAALGLSGSQPSPARVWVEDWSFEVEEQAEALTIALQAAADRVSVRLDMRATKKLLLQGGEGAADESPVAPFHFYAAPRLDAMGSITIGERTHRVQGNVWFDRAWGELPVPGGAVAANRFVVTLDNSVELSCLQLHRRSTSRAPRQSCILIDTNGAVTFLKRPALRLEALGTWVSPLDGARYPSGWRLLEAASGVDLHLQPVLEDQEANLTLRTWGGAVRVSGSLRGDRVEGNGYVELSGYGLES